MPDWIGEQKIQQEERRLLDMGAPPRDLSSVEAWRDGVDECVLQAMSFYSFYLSGQTSGMSDALSLPAVVAACDIERVPRRKRPTLTRMLLTIHSGVMQMAEIERKAKARARG